MDKLTETIPDDMPAWAMDAMCRGQFFNEACKRVEANPRLRPMHDAPLGKEILAYHIDGKNLHQIMWNTQYKRWGVRWNREYSQCDADFSGWIPMPEVKQLD